MKKQSTAYTYRAKQKELDEFKEKVVKILRFRMKSGMTFEEIARALNLSDKTVSYKLYKANHTDTELIKIATS